MKSKIGAVLLSIFGLLAGTPALAGIYADDLSKCLVKSATPTDQTTLTVWIFSAMALNPGVKQYANVSDKERDHFNADMGALYVRLMTVDCHTETVAALKYEGTASLETAFSLMGQVAMRGLLTDPQVQKGLQSLDAAFDTPKMKDLLKEAGLPSQPAK